MIAAELERLHQPATVLEDWSHLWFLGPSEIYRRCEDETKAGAICCRTERDVAIGGPMPQRIVRVWLISVSLFQRKQGRVAYADIRFSNNGSTLSII